MGQIWPNALLCKQVLLEHSLAHSFTLYLLLLLCCDSRILSGYNREARAHKSNNFYYMALYQKLCQTLLSFIQSEEPMLNRFPQTSNKDALKVSNN